jgi:hypothetical protein
MIKKGVLLLLFFLPILGLSYLWVSRGDQGKGPPDKRDHVKLKNGPYFYPIQISKYTNAKLPCIEIRINETTVSATLDLGFRGQFSFLPSFLEQIQNKEYVGSEKRHGIQGGEYEENLYEIPSIEIGPVKFSSPIAYEHSEKFNLDAIIKNDDEGSSLHEPGRVGWKLFGNTNLLLDLGNEKIAFCDSIETLKKEGYPAETFAKSPLLLERGLVEFKAEVDGCSLRCVLDTGATCNVINTDEENCKFDEESKTNFASFKIGRTEFGPISFYRFPIKIPIHIPAILGMEFFKTHLVFLDFFDNCVYFLSTQPKEGS